MSRDRDRDREREEDRERPAVDESGDSFKVFVGGISWHLTDEELLKTFKKYDATHGTIMLDKRTGRSRGFGFVLFRDKEGMEEAIRKLHGTELDGRKISVTRAIPQSETVPGTPAHHLGSGGRGGYERGYDRGGYGRYDRGAPSYRSRGPYDRPAYDRPPYDYDRGYGGYAGGYDRPSYSAYGRDPYARDYGDSRYGYDYPPAAGYERGSYPPASYDRGAGFERYNPDRGASSSGASYDRRDERYRGSGGDRDYGRYGGRPYDRAARDEERTAR